jgi:hypothetical protein
MPGCPARGGGSPVHAVLPGPPTAALPAHLPPTRPACEQGVTPPVRSSDLRAVLEAAPGGAAPRLDLGPFGREERFPAQRGIEGFGVQRVGPRKRLELFQRPEGRCEPRAAAGTGLGIPQVVLIRPGCWATASMRRAWAIASFQAWSAVSACWTRALTRGGMVVVAIVLSSRAR